MLEDSQLQSKLWRILTVFPWYQQLLPHNNDDPLTSYSYHKLPLLTSQLLEQYYYVPENPMANRADVTQYQASVGPSGRHRIIYYSAEDEEQYIARKSDLFRQILQDSKARSILSIAVNDHAAATAIAVFRGKGRKVQALSEEQITREQITPEQAALEYSAAEQQLEPLHTLYAHVWYTHPSILDRVLTGAPAHLEAYGIRKVLLVGGMTSAAWLQCSADRLNIHPTDITDTYELMEIGLIAYYSHEYGRYLIVDGILAEGIRLEDLDSEIATEPLAAEESVLVLTCLTRDYFPSLRYVTYDVVKELRPILVNGIEVMSFLRMVRRVTV